ncbi:MAG: hypothetical protein ACRCX8_12685 [Sarcina sp.]
MRRDKLTQLVVNGNKLNVIKDEKLTSVFVNIGYGFPINLDPVFRGYPHLYEHLVFNDIISGVKNITELYTMASDVNVTVNACTSQDMLIFEAELGGYILPDKRDPAYKSLKRFDTTEAGYKFLKDYILGVVRPHSFTENDIETEKGIIMAEHKSHNSTTTQAFDKILDAVCNQSVLGSPEDITNFNLSTLNEFAKQIRHPQITIRYNPNIDEVSDLEEYCIDILEKVKTGHPRFKTKETNRLPVIDDSIYDGVTDIRDIRGNNNLNCVGMVVPYCRSFKIEHLESFMMKAIAASMIRHPFIEGSLLNVLREKENLTYTMDSYGKLNGTNMEYVTVSITPISEDMDITKNGNLSDLCKIMDLAITNMPVPSETDFMTAITNALVNNAKDLVEDGIGCKFTCRQILTGETVEILEARRNLPFNFSYKKFTEIFDEVRSSITLVIM